MANSILQRYFGYSETFCTSKQLSASRSNWRICYRSITSPYSVLTVALGLAFRVRSPSRLAANSLASNMSGVALASSP